MKPLRPLAQPALTPGLPAQHVQPVRAAPAVRRRSAALLAVAVLGGCQSAPGTPAADFPEAAPILARLAPDAHLVSVVANGSESWEQVGARLQQACRERYPALGAAPVVTVLDQREVTREVDAPAPDFGLHSPGGAGVTLLGAPLPVAMVKPRLSFKKALASCAAPA